jgi:hypothetical protein
VRAMSFIRLGDHKVVGEYYRYEERVRNMLRNKRNQISKPLISSSVARENFLIWAAPGSGKSFFVEQIAASHTGLHFVQANIAKDTQAIIEQQLLAVEGSTTATLCLLDEIDKATAGACPYKLCFPRLDLNTSDAHQVVFVLIGSAGHGLHSMIELLQSLPGGKDLLDRIPSDRRFEIPAAGPEERLVIFIAKVLEAADRRGIVVNEVERLALLYVLKNDALRTPRQLRELANDAVHRMDNDDYRLKYEHLFDEARDSHPFWVQNLEAAAEFGDHYIQVGK